MALETSSIMGNVPWPRGKAHAGLPLCWVALQCHPCTGTWSSDAAWVEGHRCRSFHFFPSCPQPTAAPIGKVPDGETPRSSRRPPEHPCGDPSGQISCPWACGTRGGLPARVSVSAPSLGTWSPTQEEVTLQVPGARGWNVQAGELRAEGMSGVKQMHREEGASQVTGKSSGNFSAPAPWIFLRLPRTLALGFF